MATKLPFNYFTDGSNPITEPELVHGSGTYREAGNDNAVSTADGRIHNHRKTIEPSADFEVYGDRTDLESAAGLGVAITLKLGGAAGTLISHASFVGIITATYSAQDDKTRISIAGDPIEA
jgi:hypothetical protein